MSNTGTCNKCNTENEYSEQFCTMCGERLPWAMQRGATPQVLPQASTQSPPAKMATSTKWIIGCVAAICCIPIIIGILVFIGLTILGSKTQNTLGDSNAAMTSPR